MNHITPSRKKLSRTLAYGLTLLLSSVGISAANAQNYPERPITFVVPFAAGGTTDLVTRIVSEPLSKVLGQPVVVENRSGGGGSIGALAVLRAAPDGYTIGVASVAPTAANPAINPDTPYDPITDFRAIVNMAATPNVLVVNPNFPAKNYEEFLKVIKADPGKHAYASAGVGGIAHLQTELFKSLAGIDMIHVPYRGSAPALVDTMAGQIPVMFDNLPSALPFIREKKLIPIVVSAPERIAELPDVPTFKEVGLEQVNRMAYYGLWAPKGTPDEVINKINNGVKQVMSDPAVRERIEGLNSLVVANEPHEFAAQIKSEFETYRKLVQEQNLKPE